MPIRVTRMAMCTCTIRSNSVFLPAMEAFFRNFFGREGWEEECLHGRQSDRYGEVGERNMAQGVLFQGYYI